MINMLKQWEEDEIIVSWNSRDMLIVVGTELRMDKVLFLVFFDTVNNPATNKAATVFKPSHFAPATMREGLDMIQKLGESKIPTVFAVTDDLSPMLYKSGQFAKLTQMPQPFNNGIVMKDVMINRSVQPWMAEQILRKGGIQNFSKEELQKLFDQLNFKQAEYHTSNARTTLGDLLDMETIGKLKSIK